MTPPDIGGPRGNSGFEVSWFGKPQDRTRREMRCRTRWPEHYVQIPRAEWLFSALGSTVRVSLSHPVTGCDSETRTLAPGALYTRPRSMCASTCSGQAAPRKPPIYKRASQLHEATPGSAVHNAHIWCVFRCNHLVTPVTPWLHRMAAGCNWGFPLWLHRLHRIPLL